MGAWIEILFSAMAVTGVSYVAPFMGAWIEILVAFNIRSATL